jgi:PAS domain S-box-containing protein
MTFSRIDGNALVECLSNANDLAMLLYDDKGYVMEWNDCLQEKTGLSKKDCIGKNIEELFYSVQEPTNKVKNLALHGEATVQQAVAKVANLQAGQPGFILHHVPLPDRNQKVNWVAVFLQDKQPNALSGKTEANKIKNAIRVLSDFMHYAPIPVFIVDAELNIELANTAFHEFMNPYGGTISSMKGVVSDVLYERLKEHVGQVLESRQVLMFTEEYKPDGKVFHIYNIIFPIKDRQGSVNSVGGYFIDITDRVSQARQNKKLLEETLRLNQKLEHNNKELEDKRSELSKANKKLKSKKKELEKVVDELSDRNYELDQIMFKTSHDLRAPLTSVLGLLQLVKQETDASKIPEYLGYIENRINKLDNFVKSMLTFAKTSRSELDTKVIDWKKMITDCQEQVKYLTNYSRINFNISYNCDDVDFISDPIRLNIVLNNLLGNAVKYADTHKEKPEVNIEVENKNDKAILSIADNGIGIMREHLDKICNMFYRATDKSEGSGLGMYIVKQTVDRLEGKMYIDSEVDKGTTVKLELPQIKKKSSDIENRPPVSKAGSGSADNGIRINN